MQDQQAAGAAFIKTYTRLTRESFLALAAESHRRGIRFLGHCPEFVPLAEASDAGLHTAEQFALDGKGVPSVARTVKIG